MTAVARLGGEDRPTLGHPLRRAELVERQVESELVLYDPANDRVFFLNCTAAAIWRLCSGQHSGQEIAEFVARAYRLPEGDIALDVESTLQQLRHAGLIT